MAFIKVITHNFALNAPVGDFGRRKPYVLEALAEYQNSAGYSFYMFGDLVLNQCSAYLVQQPTLLESWFTPEACVKRSELLILSGNEMEFNVPFESRILDLTSYDGTTFNSSYIFSLDEKSAQHWFAYYCTSGKCLPSST
ncbi:hypothetical protein Tco_1319336 [Tanacetum coccineum]